MGTDLPPPIRDEPDPVLQAAITELRDRGPDRDLWPEIAGRLKPHTRPGVLQLRWPTAIAASLAMMTAAGALTFWAVRADRPAAEPVLAAETGLVMPPTGPMPVLPVGVGGEAETALVTAIDDLSTALEAAAPQLDAETRAAVTTSLVALDRAIAEAVRRAEAAPDDPRAAQYLTSTLSRKHEVLRTVVAAAGRS